MENEDKRDQSYARVKARAGTLESCLDREITWDEVSKAMIDGFSDALGINLISASPTELEMKRAGELHQERYANRIWTERI